mgnify:CR=1 FL=1
MKIIICFFSVLFLFGTLTSETEATIIDTPLPAFTDPASPWTSLADKSIITYAFKTSHDGILWDTEEKNAAYDAINLLDSYLPDQSFQETGDFTLRWAGSDFFKDWSDTGKYSDPGWNMKGEDFTDENGNNWWDPGEKFTDTNKNGIYDGPPLAVAYKHNNAPWDHDKFPNNEIYFNKNAPYGFSILGVDSDKYDFWTILLHEVIHMLACDDHATHKNEVMYESISMGERKYIQQSDLDILKKAGYKVIPEPSTNTLLIFGLLGLAWVCRKKIFL